MSSDRLTTGLQARLLPTQVHSRAKELFSTRTDEYWAPARTSDDERLGAPDMAGLGRLIQAYAPHDGSFDLRIPGLRASRYSHINTDLVHTVQMPCLCIIAQGAKSVIVGKEIYAYDVSCALVASVPLPVAAQVTRASRTEPYLAVRLDLDPQRIAELIVRVFPHGMPPVQERAAAYVSPIGQRIVDDATRLMECLGQPGDVELIAPLVVDEMLIRLLRSPVGAQVAEMGCAGSSVQRVAKAISWLYENFSQPMKVQELAGMVHMSASTFHKHFKAVTSMSPLHFQKILRLQEARRLMLSTMMDVTTAGQQVGYVSASQFSKDYSRHFGNPPTKDIARLRQQTRA